jgi:predicted methyltransferase
MRTPLLVAALALGAACSSTPAARTVPSAATSNAPVAFGSLDAAVAGAHRPAADSARDVHRHPAQTLTFFGVQPGQTVVELSPGGGWYTQILAPLLHDSGQLIEAIPAATGPRARYHERFQEFLRTRPDLYNRLRTVPFDPPGTVELGPPASADVVLTFRNLHNWQSDNGLDAVLAAVHRVLKPNGVFGVEEHRAAEGADPAVSARQGYLPQAYVVQLAQRAGFVLDAASEVNANPRDTRDHPEGVWTLPPTLRLGDRDRERYLAIGESDRMTLRFRKAPTP